jgi:predicted NAD/FAD-binding protein
MLLQVKRFHRRATHFLKTTDDSDLTTYGEFLAREGFSEHFVAHYAVPVVSCVWSAGREVALLYPARYLFRFLDHHGMLRVTGSPQWYTVVGGSGTYVERLAAMLPNIRRSSPVTDVTRRPTGVEVRDASGEVTWFDRCVIATHADQALGLLTDPSDEEVQTLKAFGYSPNETILHTDATLLPEATQARASWNYRMSSCSSPDEPTVVTYWMNRLQGHQSPQEYLVTLNARERIEPDAVLAVMDYEHPIFTPESVAAQSHLGRLATDQTVYAGAYHGWGFHEDGCRSGVDAARHFGVTW